MWPVGTVSGFAGHRQTGEALDLIWGTPVAVADAWAGRLDGSLFALDPVRVTHLVVRRGLLIRTRYVVPIESITRADSDGLFLGLPLADLLGTCLPGNREVLAESLTPRSRVRLRDGAALRVRGLRVSDDTNVTHVVVGRRSLVCPIEEVTMGAGEELSLALSAEEAARLPVRRSDDAIEVDLWEAFYEAEGISDVDLKGVQTDVAAGVVSLEGNVRATSAAADAETVARGVGGVSEVRNGLLSDWDLEMRVASLLAAREPGLSSEIAVRTHLGNVTLEGFLPSGIDRRPILDAVASIEGARGVDDLLAVRPPRPTSPGETEGERQSAEAEAAESS